MLEVRPEVVLNGRSLTPADLEAVAMGRASASLDPVAATRMVCSVERFASVASQDVLRSKWEWLIGGEPPKDSATAVRLFILGHCAGVGPPVPVEEVRALVVARANALACGVSAVRPWLVTHLLSVLDADEVPVIPSIGAVGAAGSIQLAHLARAVLGFAKGSPPTPVIPTEKEALSLINGASWTMALAGLAVARAERVLRAAEVATALSFEVIRADLRSLSPAAAQARGHQGAIAATTRLRSLVEGSELVTDGRSPDSFSVRCAPAVLGTTREALAYVSGTVTRELNAPSDNPLVFSEEGLVDAGLFHAAPVALAMDHLKAALVQMASIAERRIYRLTYGRLSGLPSFLVPGSGVNSGLMLAQYTAASVLAEARAMCVPAAVDSVPTVQHHEDHVSMGPVAARSALDVVDLVADIVGIELMCAAQGLDFRMAGRAVGPDGTLVDVAPQRPGPGTKAVYDKVRALVARWDDDRVLHADLVRVTNAVRAGDFA